MAQILEGYAFVECGYCGGRFQALQEYEYGLDTDHEALGQLVQAHWAQCTAENPYIDPNGYYGE